MDKFGTDGVLYLGLGRAPSGLVAWLQLQSDVHAAILPISELRNYPEVERFSQEHWLLLYKHLDLFLRIPPGVNKIVLIDYVSSGAGLTKSTELSDDILIERAETFPSLP